MTTNPIDEKIRQALSEEDAKLFEEFAEEPSLMEMALETLKGRNRWATALVMIVGTIFMALGVLSIVKFFSTEETKSLIAWAMGFAFCMGAVSMMKIWAWMEIEKNSTLREIKRLELQVARLSQQLSETPR